MLEFDLERCVRTLREVECRNRCDDDDGSEGGQDELMMMMIMMMIVHVSIETGSPGTDERGESLPQSHRRHLTGEAAQPALGTPSSASDQCSSGC